MTRPDSDLRAEYRELASRLQQAAFAEGVNEFLEGASDARITRDSDANRAARAALDAFMDRLLDALAQIAGLVMVDQEGGILPASMSYMRPDDYYHRVQAIVHEAIGSPVQQSAPSAGLANTLVDIARDYFRCVCTEDYTKRGMTDPQCNGHDGVAEDLRKAAAALASRPADPREPTCEKAGGE